MAEFQDAYDITRKYFEGGYVNIPSDKGGETYGGIARNFHPENEIWVYIDYIKRTKYSSGITRNKHFPDIEYIVENFYHEFWKKYHLAEIHSQKVANLIFDYIIHSEKRAIKNIQKIVDVNQDGIIGPITLRAINSRNPTVLYSLILNERKKYLNSLIEKNPSQEVFRTGWENRLKFLASLNKETGIAGIILILIFVFTLTKIL